MANLLKGQVPLKLGDGREFTLVLDFEALVHAEQAYGKPLGQLMADALHEYVGAGRALLFGALRTYHPEISLRAVSEIYIPNQAVILEALTAAIEAAFPPGGAEGKGSGNVPPDGKNSGPNGAKQASTPKRSGKPRRARSV